MEGSGWFSPDTLMHPLTADPLSSTKDPPNGQPPSNQVLSMLLEVLGRQGTTGAKCQG